MLSLFSIISDDYQRLMKIVLVSGAPGSGKSTIASAIAKKLGIYQTLGTDSIREVLRYVIPEEESPSLHTSAIKIEEPYRNYPMETVGFMRQADDVKPGIEAIIKRSIKEEKDLILEGIHLIPGEYEISAQVEFKNIIVVVDENDHKKYLLGQREDRSSYKLENFQKARAFQEYLVNKVEGLENSLIVENNGDIEKVEELVGNIL
ncbi:AAA family ATPase [Candidatus Dojkabacteria bacterium]|nr:AAA family ATPase [Candidatus Dojkabacteria bacterium]